VTGCLIGFTKAIDRKGLIMKVQLNKADMSELPGIIAVFQNGNKTITIKVLDDVSYEITRNDKTLKTNMSWKYLVGSQLVKHIENDIKDGYYGGVKRIA
jgi:predicted AAA+ superfamily ATPase